MNRILIIIVILLLGIYAGTYVFNHYNAWLGMLIILATISATIYLIFRKK